MRERFRLVAAEVETVPLPAPMPNLPVGRAVWRSKPDFATAATCWMEAGGAHHTVMSTQTSLTTWEVFARSVGVELATIDAATTVPAFVRDLRASAAYYRLTRAL